MSEWLVGVDTGGSFTDLFAYERSTREIRVVKVPSAPDAPATAVIGALEAFLETGVSADEIHTFAHGTTVAANALLEGKGARSGLLITEGFRAVYEARGWMRPEGADVVDPFYRKPALLIPQRLTEEIRERVDFRGEVLCPLDEQGVRAAARRLEAEGVEAVAICYLFSFLAPEHEQRTAQVIAEEAPRLRVSASHRVLPTIREYPRLSTTVVDACVGPIVERYLRDLGKRLRARGIRTPRAFLMQSHGGLMHLEAGARLPNHTLLSGQAAGVVSGIELARASGIRRALTFDMGGTSADIGVVYDDRVRLSDQGRVAGQEVATPMLDIHTLGAGGGSISWIGEDGLLKVGPQSAGAIPGPACYGRDGHLPTVTDAHLVLGALGRRLIGGGLRLDASLALAAIAPLAERLRLDPVYAASGIIRIINNTMAAQLRLALQRQGHDPRDFTLIAFGGAGPLHAAQLARLLSIPRVLVPLYPGITSAAGLLRAPVRYVEVISEVGMLEPFPAERMGHIFAELEARALASLAEYASDATTKRQVDLRYRQQGFELTIDLPPGELTAQTKAKLKRDFDEMHRRLYGHHAPHEDAEVITFRLTAETPLGRLGERAAPPRGAGQRTTPLGCRPLYDPETRGFREATVYDRGQLGANDSLSGPAIVEQLDATTLVLQGQHARVDGQGNLIIEETSP